ncbi:class I SAM-dependent methyltransferase [Nocardioides sp. GXZ039]|uniref:class I SAM-dependent methyltransferase n=1 Tax=Nocardioides sp. GXZ039 TaxID=3136018 RepID=UPI0030F3CAFF
MHSTWPGLSDSGHNEWYIGRFRELAARGEDLQGEARLVEALAAPASRLLDAGCGPGRHGGYLARRGHHVVGVDVDPMLIEAARSDHPDATWLVSDLVTLDLAASGQPEPFDGAFIAGNVMDFVTEADRATVIERVAAHLRADGFLVVGCRTSQGFTPADLDAALPVAGLTLEQRFATWDLRPWRADAEFCVSVARR